MLWEALVAVVTGAAVGWLVGLSTTPVIAGVIATLATGAAALAGSAGAAQGANGTTLRRVVARVQNQPAAWRLAALTVGIAIGASCGLKARNSEWFAPPPPNIKAIVDRWTQAGAKPDQVITHLLARGIEASTPTELGPSLPSGLVATALAGEECKELQVLAPNDILPTLAASIHPELRALAKEIETLKAGDRLGPLLRDALCSSAIH